MQEAHHKEVHSLKQKEKQTQEELARTRRDMVRTREHWFEVFEDLEKEYRNEIKKLEKQLKFMTAEEQIQCLYVDHLVWERQL